MTEVCYRAIDKVQDFGNNVAYTAGWTNERIYCVLECFNVRTLVKKKNKAEAELHHAL